MLRPLHFVLLFIALAFMVSVLAVEDQADSAPIEVEEQHEPEMNDLEADASYWGYSRPYRYYGHYGGWRAPWGYRNPWYYGRGWGGRSWAWY